MTSPPCQPPETTSVLPVLLLGDEDPRLRVYYCEQDAVAAAHESPQEDCFDSRGYRLERVSGADGCLALKAVEGDGAEALRERVMDALRSTAAMPTLSAKTTSGLQESLEWIEKAPDLPSVVNALGLYPVQYLSRYTCQKGCSAWMRVHPHPGPPCCPGA